MISTKLGMAGAVALAVLAVAGLGRSANAQAPVAHMGAKHEGHLAKMATELGLTETQKTQIKPILADAKANKKAINDDKSLSPEQKKAKLKEMGKATKEKIAAILTPAQKAKRKADHAAHHAKIGK